MNKIQKTMLEEFVCPGCINGSSSDCGMLNFCNNTCNNHKSGTLSFAGSF